MSTIHEERARASLQAGLAVIPATLLYSQPTLLPIASVFLVLFTTTDITAITAITIITIIYTAPSSTRRRQFIYLAKAF